MKDRTNDVAVPAADKTSAVTQNDVSGKPQITREWLLDMLVLNLKTSLGTEPLMIPLKLIRKDGSGEITRGAPVYIPDRTHAKAFDLLVKWVGLPKNTPAEAAPKESSLGAVSDDEVASLLVRGWNPDAKQRLFEWLQEFKDLTPEQIHEQEDELLRSFSRSSTL